MSKKRLKVDELSTSLIPKDLTDTEADSLGLVHEEFCAVLCCKVQYKRKLSLQQCFFADYR
jgi:hypothetical protein